MPVSYDEDLSEGVHPSDLLAEMLSAALSAGVEMGYLVTSREIAEAAGWTRSMRRDDRGDSWLLGMRVCYVDSNVVEVRAADADAPLTTAMPDSLLFCVDYSGDDPVLVQADA